MKVNENGKPRYWGSVASLMAILVVIAIGIWIYPPHGDEGSSQVRHDEAQSAMSGAKELSAPPSEDALPAADQRAPSAPRGSFSIEHAAPWPALIHFETDNERTARHLRGDPFDVVAQLPELLGRAGRGDSQAAFLLHELAEYCDQHVGRTNPHPDAIQLDCSVPKTWSRSQRRSWTMQAVFSGERSPAMTLMMEAERMGPSDERLPNAATDAVMSLDFAARRGCLECVVMLAEIYRSGGIVQQDLRRSFAYLQVAAAASGDAAYAAHAEQIRPSLRPIDLEFARSLQARLAKALANSKAR